jgi:hypothetical protein
MRLFFIKPARMQENGGLKILNGILQQTDEL